MSRSRLITGLSVLVLAIVAGASVAYFRAPLFGQAVGGDGGFGNPTGYLTGNDVPFRLAAGDMNGDGKPDLAISHMQQNVISVFLNNGNGTFAARSTYPAVTPYAIAVGDLNADGKADIVTANFTANSASIFLNNGNGTFAAKVDLPTGQTPMGITLADVNTDGKLDMVVTNQASNTVSVFMGNGNGTFVAKADYITGAVLNGGQYTGLGPMDVAIGDMNADAKPDLALATTRSFSVLFNNGNGTFGPGYEYGQSVSGNGLGVALGDFNGDGQLDVANTVNGNLYNGTQYPSFVNIFLNKGMGDFPRIFAVHTPDSSHNPGNRVGIVTVADFTGDGVGDLAVANITTGVSTYINLQNGTFAPRTQYLNDNAGSILNVDKGVVLADFNGDGKTDMAVTSIAGKGVSIYLNGARTPRCRDGIKDANEECDDGNSTNTDACLNSCVAARCGDASVQTGVEQCDDGNQTETDACSAQCQFAVCGDGFVRAGVEQCDDGNQDNADTCSNFCRLPVCGDGFKHPSEECDDSVNETVKIRYLGTTITNWNVTFNGYTTPLLAADAPAVTVQSALEALTSIGAGNVFVSKTGTLAAGTIEYLVTFINARGASDQPNNFFGVTGPLSTPLVANGVAPSNTAACTTQCRNAVCGDTFVQAGVEECDDGNQNNADACTNTCTIPVVCGDGSKAGAEECDDGNQTNTDACTTQCKNAVCGDTFVQTGVEQCDDGNQVGTDACSNQCTTPVCGDGIVSGTEQCDEGRDGNEVQEIVFTSVRTSWRIAFNGSVSGLISGDAATADNVKTALEAMPSVGAGNVTVTRTLISGKFRFTVTFIGALGHADQPEMTVQNITAVINELAKGGSYGSIISNDVCTEDCRVPACGDGVRQGGEQCDDGNQISTDACTNQCKTFTCGDGVIRTGFETCDDANVNAGDGCSGACAVESGFACTGTPSACVVTCGNGTVEVGEQCDDGNQTNTDGCTNTCKLPVCGDGVRQGNEECDEPTVPVGEVQQITYNGGIHVDWKVNFNGAVSAAIPPTSTVEAVKAALEAMSTIGAGNISVVKTCDITCPFHRYTVTFINARAGINQTQMAQVQGPLSLATITQGGPGTPSTTCGNTCRFFACGDGIVQSGEQCDDGNAVNTDACSAACKLPGCGDGVVQGIEACDDGNAVNTDGCTNACKLPACGDGIKTGTEACDDGNQTNTDGCTNACKLPVCGDGIVTGSEQCDDGNALNTDACTNACKAPACGDGAVQGAEQCDDGNTVNTDACSNTCVAPGCGDGIRNGSEACDNGALNSNIVPNGCRSNCSLFRCGDGVRDGGEQCDDGNAANDDSCTNACAPAACGDRIVQANETCDDGNRTGGDGCDVFCRGEQVAVLPILLVSSPTPTITPTPTPTTIAPAITVPTPAARPSTVSTAAPSALPPPPSAFTPPPSAAPSPASPFAPTQQQPTVALSAPSAAPSPASPFTSPPPSAPSVTPTVVPSLTAPSSVAPSAGTPSAPVRPAAAPREPVAAPSVQPSPIPQAQSPVQVAQQPVGQSDPSFPAAPTIAPTPTTTVAFVPSGPADAPRVEVPQGYITEVLSDRARNAGQVLQQPSPQDPSPRPTPSPTFVATTIDIPFVHEAPPEDAFAPLPGQGAYNRPPRTADTGPVTVVVMAAGAAAGAAWIRRRKR